MMKHRAIAFCSSPLVSLIFRWCLGIIFLYAGYVKANDPQGFAQAIYNYRLLPEWMINPMAIFLPWVELLVGISLLLGIWIDGASLVASGLLAIFAGALGISLARGLDIACGCFSTQSSSDSITWLHLFRDVALMGMGIHVVLLDQGLASVGRWVRKMIPAF